MEVPILISKEALVNLLRGAFSRDFITNLAPQCRAFIMALKIEKIRAPGLSGQYK